MLDLKYVRENPDAVRTMLEQRRTSAALDELLEWDAKWRHTQVDLDSVRHRQNVVSKEIARLKKEKQDASALIEEMREVSSNIKTLTETARVARGKVEQLLLTIPNMPHASTPVGSSESDNVVVRSWGIPPRLDFEAKPHWEIGGQLGLFDLERSSKITGSNFITFKGQGARLERSLINFMLDLHVQKHGYTEISPPFVVNRKSMTGTGQLPKMEEDMYLCEVDDLFLIPTAEVPVTNLFADEILDAETLPIYYTAYTPCFRREAGSYGRDTRGLIRVHQFDKVEMVRFVLPEVSYDEHESLLENAEEVLQLLGLHYRVLNLCTVDISFAAAKCYDLEVWAAGQQAYLEVSSCSNFEDFQARRANIRFRRAKNAKPEFIHTLNASGLALPRTVIAILENYQLPDGRVRVPEVLRSYMGGTEYLG